MTVWVCTITQWKKKIPKGKVEGIRSTDNDLDDWIISTDSDLDDWIISRDSDLDDWAISRFNDLGDWRTLKTGKEWAWPGT